MKKQPKKEADVKTQPQIQLVRMRRESPEPLTADVHPLEVENYRKGGYEVEQLGTHGSSKT
jgi:hypothetical protein